MADKTKLKTYCVQATLHLVVSIEVSAHSLDEALEKAKTFKEDDFVDIQGEYLDGNIKITGIYTADLDV